MFVKVLTCSTILCIVTGLSIGIFALFMKVDVWLAEVAAFAMFGAWLGGIVLLAVGSGLIICGSHSDRDTDA
jgi:hypothetical protein